ncbi:Stage II sporulation protein E (SpoIIE) [Streptomyces sp. FR-008]|nr:Stage II sporulation protein E (SpoIIE) [Streptomyces sp. FR-008]
MAGIDSAVPAPAQTVAPSPQPPAAPAPPPSTAVQDRLAGWVSDLTTLHELTERLIATATVDAALRELLHAGASLVGARRGLAALEPGGPGGPGAAFTGLGLGRADLGHIETVPRAASCHGRLLDEPPGGRREICHPDLATDHTADPRHREVAARLGWAASYAAALETGSEGRFGAVVWLYDEPAEPDERRRHLTGLYLRQAGEHLARLLTLDAARATLATLREELLPSRLPRVPGVRLAARHRTGPRGGGDWYDALPLPEGALGLAIGSVTGSGPSAVAAMGRLRASLRAYAVMEGEDPVAVLSDLELLLRLTEPARSATALFGYCEPAEGPGPERGRRLVLAGGRALPAGGRQRARRRVRGDLALRAAGHARLLGGAQCGAAAPARRHRPPLQRRAAAADRRRDGPGLRPAALGRRLGPPGPAGGPGGRRRPHPHHPAPRGARRRGERGGRGPARRPLRLTRGTGPRAPG